MRAVLLESVKHWIPMKRRLSVVVDQATWPQPPNLPAFPSSFPRRPRTAEFNIPAVLLLIGQLTTPPTARGTSLSEYWAWVRYLCAITSDRGLRLTKDFSELDAHQKTILSDDFGMGLPMYWLKKRLRLRRIVGGQYFIDSVAASVGATAPRTAKRGPNKSPDFVGLDNNGVWHVVECKGTQSGEQYRETQLRGPDRQSGAVQQKATIVFPAGHSGQRLACGVSLSREGDPTRSSLKVIDPPLIEKPFEILQDYMPAAEEATARSTIAVGLRLAGFQVASDAIASPVGPRASSRRTRGSQEEDRQAFVKERRGRAYADLERGSKQTRFEFRGGVYVGRELVLDLPRPFLDDDRLVGRVVIRQGVSREALAFLQREGFPDERNIDFKSFEPLGSTSMYFDEEEEEADLRIGKIFVSTIKLTTTG